MHREGFMAKGLMAKKSKGKKGGRDSVVVTSKVKAFIRAGKMICAGDLASAVDGKVREMLKAASARASANKRSTVRPQDL
jgi:hypothetical protein